MPALDNDAQEAITAYERKRPTYERYTTSLASLLSTLLTDAGVRVHTIEHRAKTVESFRAKLARPEKVPRSNAGDDRSRGCARNRVLQS